MKKNITRQNAVYALLLVAALCCTACGQDAGETSDPNAAELPSDSIAEGEISDEQSDEGQTEPDSAQDDTSVGNSASDITITMQTETSESTGEDGTVYSTKSYTYPIVSIDGNSTAADQINADILARIEAFKADTTAETLAKEEYDFIKTEYPDDTFNSYSEELSFSTRRSDSNVISFTELNYSYTGGAHGNYTTRGFNYNAKTGERLAFADLSEDSNAFREDTLAYNQALAKTESYKERMFSEEDIAGGSLESVLYADDVWYLSTSGLTFISDPYELGPYAAGTIEFIIPYSDLADMGFMESYAYSGNYVRKLQMKDTYQIDLNGDGQEDSILFYTEDVESADGTYSTLPHLIINDTDFAQEGDDGANSVRAQIAEYSYPEYGIYDLVPDDNYREIMFVAGEMEGNDYVYYSHFFRYAEDGSLTYLGRTPGDANDPTVSAAELEISITD